MIPGATKSVAENFADWEGAVFGFGYGTGEPYIIPAVSSFLICCKGAMGSYSYEDLERDLGATSAWLLINTFARADIIEYGTSPRFGWLTPKGRALRRFMLAHTNDALLTMTQRDENASICSPGACNCGPSGYWEGHKCVNPFWTDSVAHQWLAEPVSATELAGTENTNGK